MNVFDIVGPVMIGPSSSHTAGAARIGLIARALLGAPAVTADIRLHGSFAKTYRGHGTDKALVAGIHPNTALITLTDAQGHTVSVQGASVGGGNILVTRVNGMAVEITGQYTTLIVLHRDAPGTIAAVTEEMSRRGVNICNFRLSRAQKGGTAVMTIEVDGALEPDVNSCVEKLPNVLSSTMLAPM